MRKSTLSLGVITAAGLFACTSALAQYTVKIGYANVDPGANAGATTGPFIPPNSTSLNVGTQQTVFFSISREITDKWDVELALGVPPTHDVTLRVINPASLPPSAAAQNGKLIGTVRQIAPTLFANYKFGDKADSFRPFIGVGLNYTMFDQANSTALFNQLSGGSTNNSLTDSFGFAAQLGATYKVNGPWSITGSWSTADVNSTLTNNTYGTLRKTNINFKPSVLVLAVGYSF
jgi:outer membrane protein